MTIFLRWLRRRRRKWLLAFGLSAFLCLFGCGGKTSFAEETDSVRASSEIPVNTLTDTETFDTVALAQTQKQTEAESENKQPTGKLITADDLLLAEYHGEVASSEGQVEIDVSAADEGYLGFSASSSKTMKVQIIKDDMTYTYNLASDGTPSIYPLQCGNGSYYYQVLENVVDTKYARVTDGYVDVAMEDEFSPFLRPSDYSKYDEKSKCVAKAAELSDGAGDSLETVTAIFEYLRDNIKYDTEKAKTVKSTYMPTPDETLETGKGICFDYASLAAAMLRSQGIPTKLVFGYVSPNDLYHAWNMFYTEETGWVTVEFKANAEAWNRMDITFSASGAPAEFVGNGGNYADLYYY